jgi:transposase InsO family protein
MVSASVGNLASQTGIFPDYKAPIVRNTPDGRELAMARWACPRRCLHCKARTPIRASPTCAISTARTGAAGLHRIERLMRKEGLRDRPRRRGLPKDAGQRHAVSPNILDRAFAASAPNQIGAETPRGFTTYYH